MKENEFGFAKECLDNNWNGYDNDYKIQKVRLLAKEMKIVNNIEDFSKELLDKIIKDYKEEVENRNIENEKKESSEMMKIDLEKCGKYDEYKNDDVKTKRQKEIQKHIDVLKVFEKSDAQLIEAFYYSNGGGQKETNWAMMGGLADGIAGPGAGVAVALDTQINNLKIQNNNKKIMSTSFNEFQRIKPAVDSKRHELEFFKNQLEATKLAYVSNNEEIVKYFHLSNIKLSKNKVKTLTIEMDLTLDERIKEIMPNGVNCTVDGSFDLYICNYDNEPLCKATVILPIFGVIPNNIETHKLKSYVTLSDLDVSTKYNYFYYGRNLSIIETDKRCSSEYYIYSYYKNDVNAEVIKTGRDAFRNTPLTYNLNNAKYVMSLSKINSSYKIDALTSAIEYVSKYDNELSKKYIEIAKSKIDSIKKEEEQRKIKEEAQKKRNRTIIISIFATLLLAVLYFFVYMPMKEERENKATYQNAVELLDNKNFDEAISKFKELGEYEDSKEMVTKSMFLQAVDCYENNCFDKAKEVFRNLYEIDSNYSDEYSYYISLIEYKITSNLEDKITAYSGIEYTLDILNNQELINKLNSEKKEIEKEILESAMNKYVENNVISSKEAEFMLNSISKYKTPLNKEEIEELITNNQLQINRKNYVFNSDGSYISNDWQSGLDIRVEKNYSIVHDDGWNLFISLARYREGSVPYQGKFEYVDYQLDSTYKIYKYDDDNYFFERVKAYEKTDFKKEMEHVIHLCKVCH